MSRALDNIDTSSYRFIKIRSDRMDRPYKRMTVYRAESRRIFQSSPGSPSCGKHNYFLSAIDAECLPLTLPFESDGRVKNRSTGSPPLRRRLLLASSPDRDAGSCMPFRKSPGKDSLHEAFGKGTSGCTLHILARRPGASGDFVIHFACNLKPYNSKGAFSPIFEILIASLAPSTVVRAMCQYDLSPLSVMLRFFLFSRSQE